MTYGQHQEDASRALNRLLTEPGPAPPRSEVAVRCRAAAIQALLERLRFLHGRHQPHRQSREIKMAAVVQHPRRQLLTLVESLPRGRFGAAAPTELLPGPPVDQAASGEDLWRCVARSLCLGNADLSGADSAPWFTAPAAMRHLVADTALVAEAIIVLDDRSSSPAKTRDRLLASSVAQVSRWHGTDPNPDLASASPLARLGLYDGPRIHMVRRPDDYAAAQRALAGFLHAARSRGPDAGERPGIKAARALAVGQIRLAKAFAAAAQAAGATDLASAFTDRIPALTALHQSTARLVDAAPPWSSLLLAQQSELVMQLRSVSPARLSAVQLADVNHATDEVTVNLGKALRVEGIQRRNLLTLPARGRDGERARAITSSRHPFNAACQALARDEPPSPAGRSAPTQARATLRESVAQVSR